MHRIYARHRAIAMDMRLPITVIKRAVRETLRCEGVSAACEVSLLITDDNGIHAINREFRAVDEPTDVLSFPLQSLTPGKFDVSSAERDLTTGLIPLGDIVLSAERVDRQAREYGHSLASEAAYLTVHSTLHLLGYDHMDEADDKRKMRAREEFIMAEMGPAFLNKKK